MRVKRAGIAVMAAAGVTAAAVAARKARSARPTTRTGTFGNGMDYARLGDGPRSLLWLAESSNRMGLAMMTRFVRPFVTDGYTVWLVSLPRNMPTGHTIADMADDYALLIQEEFDGAVDVVIGHSTGGLIGLSLAARHPDRFGHIVIAGAGLWSQRADTANLETARLLVAGRTREAGANAVRTLRPDIRVPGLATALGTLLARVSLAEYSAEDLLVSAEATHAFDPHEVLPTISVPVLLVGGDRDVWFEVEDIEEAARLIPNCTLKLYPDTTHFGALRSPRFAEEVREFVRGGVSDGAPGPRTAMEVAEGILWVDGIRWSNVYVVVAEDGLVLVDTGAGFAGSIRHICQAIAATGHRPSDVGDIVLTHYDADHVGGLASIKARTGARVAIHELDAPVVMKKEPPGARVPLLVRVIYRWFLRAVAPDRLLKDGDVVGGLRVVHVPGHTAGCIALAREDGAVFSGVALLADKHGNFRPPDP